MDQTIHILYFGGPFDYSAYIYTHTYTPHTLLSHIVWIKSEPDSPKHQEPNNNNNKKQQEQQQQQEESDREMPNSDDNNCNYTTTIATRRDIVRKTSAAHQHSSRTLVDEGDDPDHDDDDCEHGPNKDRKKMKRILANRGSARASYQRRKKMLVELQATVKELNQQNSLLEAENKEIRLEIQTIRQQMRILLLSSSSSTSVPTTTPSRPQQMLSLLDSLNMKYAAAAGASQTAITTAQSQQQQQQQQQHLSMSHPPYNHDLLAQLLASDQASSMSPGLQSLWNEQLLVRSLAGLPQRGLGL